MGHNANSYHHITWSTLQPDARKFRKMRASAGTVAERDTTTLSLLDRHLGKLCQDSILLTSEAEWDYVNNGICEWLTITSHVPFRFTWLHVINGYLTAWYSRQEDLYNHGELFSHGKVVTFLNDSSQQSSFIFWVFIFSPFNNSLHPSTLSQVSLRSQRNQLNKTLFNLEIFNEIT
jgi:hypothetical protein